VIKAPGAPLVGERLVICGDTVKVTALLATPNTVTTTLPVVAAMGTGTAIVVAVQLVGVAAVPLNVTVLSSWLDPKLFPVIVTDAPVRPEFGEIPVIAGATSTFGVNVSLATKLSAVPLSDV
jgi:hypothetical protein